MPGHREEYLSDAPPAEREASGSPLKGGGQLHEDVPAWEFILNSW